jgi:tetratricopeptide (TPR) repeat protein
MRLVIILISFFILLSPSAYAVSIPVGRMAPDFILSSVEGKTISLNEYKGKIVVFIYWETGQNRSLTALQDGEDIFKRFHQKGVEFIGIVADTEHEEDVKKIIKDNEIDFPVLVDTGRRVYGDYGVRVYPSTGVIDKEGRLAYDIPGHALTYKLTLEGYIRYMLGEVGEEKLSEIISTSKETKDESAFEAERRYNLAIKFTEARLIEQAIEAVKKSIEAKPDVAKSRILLGFLFLDIKEADKAYAEFNKAIELDPVSHDAKTGLGGALILKGNVDKAVEILTDAATANPYPQMTYYELGKAYELKGEKDKAIEMYKKALDKIINKKILPAAVSKCQ